jgi:hypothetical protein
MQLNQRERYILVTVIAVSFFACYHLGLFGGGDRDSTGGGGSTQRSRPIAIASVSTAGLDNIDTTQNAVGEDLTENWSFASEDGLDATPAESLDIEQSATVTVRRRTGGSPVPAPPPPPPAPPAPLPLHAQPASYSDSVTQQERTSSETQWLKFWPDPQPAPTKPPRKFRRMTVVSGAAGVAGSR